jgi:hypothetical protein
MSDINKELAELLGLCWHRNKIQLYSGGEIRYSCENCGSMDYNPDFTTDSGKIELLRLMMKREDWERFKFQIECQGYDHIPGNCVKLNLILDTTGLLAQAAVEWLRKESA